MKRPLKSIAIRLLLFTILVFFSITGFSAKYYVSVKGNNKFNGSNNKPWLTLAYACTKAINPGDIIHVNAGTYNETLRANLAVGVSIEGDGIDRTIINTNYVATNSSDASILLNSSSYINGNQSISNLTLTGSNLTSTRGICINYRNNVSVNDCKITNFYASGIFFRGSKMAWDVEPNLYCTGNKVFNIQVNNCATRSNGESANIRINGQSGFLLYNSSFNQTTRPIGQNGNILGGEWNKGLKIYNNTFTKPDNEGSEWNFFFELWHWQGGGEIYNNIFNGAATMDIVDVMKTTYEFGLKIYENKYIVNAVVPFTDHQIQAINLEGQSHLEDVHVYHNYMKNVPNGIWVDAVVNESEGYFSFDVHNLYIHHNVMENIGMTDVNTIPIWMNAYGSNTNISFNNIQINNNTIHCSNILKGLNAIKWSIIGKFSNLYIQNNILTNCKEDVITFAAQMSGATLTDVTIKNNLYYNNGVDVPKFNLAANNKTESDNLTGNPLFVSSTDLNLQENSPAINRGINVGMPFNGSAPDIGGIESTITNLDADISKPVISSFTIPTSSTTLTIPITTFTATDNVGVTGYLITRSTTTPLATDAGWSTNIPSTYSFTSTGTKILYAWVKDAGGNVSSYVSQSITITIPVSDTSSPIISSFTTPASSTTLTIPITTFTATDNVGVTGYLITRSTTTPLATDAGWSSNKPANYTFTSIGTKILYAWVKDAADNISSYVSQTIIINTEVIGVTPSNTYYLSPTGDDTYGNGSSSSPWNTINKAWSVAKAGDVIYMKGGTYSYSSTQNLKGKSGSSGNPIKIWAAPGEKPVITPSSSFSGIRGIDMECNYVHIKGLEVCNYKQRSGSSFIFPIYAQNSNYLTFELLVVHDNGFGLSISQDSGDNLILNCDCYRNSDPLTNIDGMIPYGGADGITIRSSNPDKTNTIRGCRMWWNSDDGVDLFGNNGTIIIENSWAFWNGYIPGTFTTAGDGNGFKLGNTSMDLSTSVKRIIRYNLAFQNRKIGFDQNQAWCITHIYNNTSYDNANMGSPARSYSFAYGPQAHVAKNNIDYKTSMSAYFSDQSTVTNTSFLKNGSVNTAYSVSSSDFLSLDPTGVDGPRQSDGSLPNLDFLKLALGSDLVNKGIDVGMPYNGSAPDLGALESNYSTSGVNSSNLSAIQNEIDESIQIGQLTTDVPDIIISIKIDIFPNPCKEHMTVRLNEIPSGESRIEIINITGKLIESRNIENLQEIFNLSGKPNGLYIVKTIIGNKEIKNKLLINN